MSNPVFSYAISPNDVDYSASEAQISIVTLTLTVIGAATATDCSAISLAIPYGIGSTALTVDPSTISVAPGPSTPWAIAPMGGGIFTAVPLPPVTGLAADQQISFVLSNVVVNEAGGTVAIAITEVTTQTGSTSVSVDKDAVISTGGSTPAIVSFTATPAEVALGAQTTLSWTVNNATSCVLDPGAISLSSVSKGTLPLTVDETTIYTLSALSTGGSAEAVATVAVMSVVLDSFTASPATPVPPGTPVTLQWSTDFASSCSIDQGIGPVATASSTTVTPQQTTVYTLTANGLNPQTSSVRVTVSST